MKRLLQCFTILPVLLLAACAVVPSESRIRQQVTDLLASEGGDELYEVVDFRQLDGTPYDKLTYIADVSFGLRFKKGLDDITREAKIRGDDYLSIQMGSQALQQYFGDFRAGDVLQRNIEVTFKKTDNGWILQEP